MIIYQSPDVNPTQTIPIVSSVNPSDFTNWSILTNKFSSFSHPSSSLHAKYSVPQDVTPAQIDSSDEIPTVTQGEK